VTAGTRTWAVRLTAAAEGDFLDILRWTAEQFGEAQARAYGGTLSGALEALTEGSAVIGVKARDDIGKGLFTLHVARRGRRGRHFVVFRIGHDQGREVIEVLRLLHDAMDLPRHLPTIDDGE
jgi:toxin ParE1/3/4